MTDETPPRDGESGPPPGVSASAPDAASPGSVDSATGLEAAEQGATPASAGSGAEPEVAAPVATSVPAADPRTRRAGILARLRKRRLALGAIAFVVAFAVLGTGAVAAGHAMAESRAAAEQKADVAESAKPSARPRPDTIAAPARLRSCSISPLAGDTRLGTFEGTVISATGGDALYDRGGATPVRPGSAMKLLTAGAALSVLGPDYRIPTTVIDAGDDSIAIVGHGDATLSAQPAGSASVYAGAPKLADLLSTAASTWTSRHPGKTISTVLLDASYWGTGDSWDATWPTALQTTGVVSKVTSLQLDGDRADPAVAISPRSDDPVAAVGAKALAALRAAAPGLVADDATALAATAPAGGTEIAQVQSQPVSQLVGQMLSLDDATLAETLGRLVSKKQGDGGSAASLTGTYATALAGYGVATTGIVVHDGSGLSTDDAVSAVFLARFAAEIAQSHDDLALLRTQLGRSGQSGALAGRFGGTSSADGAVEAFSGGGPGVRTLIGTVQAADGTALAFAFLGVGDAVNETADPALDALAAALHDCGANLSSI
ncbi:D-alanyl-D-alanine carboxypeptidase [Schumannella soli]|uniref:D-alanyl-D-alanine carboxypeptidase/D-alanyl-D-alanine-endopeptidase n=1 Tax=Schumannella soli TaxID=2590779 RepID=A0A506Y5M4_9MICO|nr:D-alanyl-D-alanine carboxypeptidase [Schumannella soli]TPW77302.1 D-alanyl-D-alanine carboxypeptidase/D-alanyl-D-alanine-endopeptidase [Schumannella soli]